MVAAHAVEQTEAHRLIEQLMILTNEQVAELLRAPRRADALPRPRAARSGRGSPILFEKLAALDIPTPPLPAR